MSLPSIYYFDNVEAINLDEINGNAIVISHYDDGSYCIKTVKDGEEIATINRKDYSDFYQLVNPIESIKNYLAINQLNKIDEIDIAIHSELKILVRNLACPLNFPYAYYTVGLSRTAENHPYIKFYGNVIMELFHDRKSSIAIKLAMVRNQHPLLQSATSFNEERGYNRGYEGFDALNLLRDSELQQYLEYLIEGGIDVGTDPLPFMHQLLASTNDVYQKMYEEKNKIINHQFKTKSALGQQKAAILNDFANYCALHATLNSTTVNLVREWLEHYQNKYAENPFLVLNEQRRTGLLGRFFNPSHTDSYKLFEKFMRNEGKIPEDIQTMMNASGQKEKESVNNFV